MIVGMANNCTGQRSRSNKEGLNHSSLNNNMVTWHLRTQEGGRGMT